jgi:hypothetical protein
VKCDGQIVASGLTSDAAGRFSTSFVIPAAARDGSRIVEVSDGSRRAETDLLANHPFSISRIQRVVVERPLVRRAGGDSSSAPRIVRLPVARTVWRSRTKPRAVGPIAQTWSVAESRVVSALGLYFSAKDASLPVTVQIRGVTTGFPNEVVLAEKTLAPAEISIVGETRVTFSDPVYVEGGAPYAVVLLTSSAVTKVRVATLGQQGSRGILTSQACEGGNLLESLDGQEWAPVSGSDLTMALYGYDFLGTGVVQFRPLTGLQLSQLVLDEYSTASEGTGLVWELSLDGGASWSALVPAEEEQLPAVISQALLRVRFGSMRPNESPVLNYKDVNLVGYLNSSAGVYVSRETELTQGVGSVKVYSEMSIPSGTTVGWFASNDGGATWEPMAVEATRPLDEEWTEYALGRAFANPAGNRVRFKAVMTGTSLLVPKIHTLEATLS